MRQNRRIWDYIHKFTGPYDKARGIDLEDQETVDKGTNLRTYTAAFQGNQNIWLVANRNDLFLAKEDVEWIESTFGPGHVALVEHGGHWGNLAQPAVRQAIREPLKGLEDFQTVSSTQRR